MPSFTSTIRTIKKRNGTIVDFNPDKITAAVRKAFTAVRGGVSDEELREITVTTINRLEQEFANALLSVEDVQNATEQVLMSKNYFDVAKDYILYRYEHTKARQQEAAPVMASGLKVVKRDGKTETFSQEKVMKALHASAKGIEQDVDLNAIAVQAQNDIYDGVKTTEITQALIMTARSFIERDPAYSQLASRLLARKLYKDIIGPDRMNWDKLEQLYRETFVRNIQKAVALQRLDPRILMFNLEAMSKHLVIERDDLLMYLGMQTLSDRYFLADPNTKQILELPQAFWMRVAMGLALNEGENREEQARRFYNVISTMRFTPSTPTLFHAGTSHPQLSSCYLTTVEDSLDHIFKCIADNAQLSKWSGGLGNDWTNLRGTGSLIKGTGVESQGIIPFLKVANDATAAINRSGRRRGATCAYLETWHLDIEDFIELRKNTGDERRRTHDMDTANWIPDTFMKRVKEDGRWTLFSPDETPDLHHTYGKAFEERYVAYEKLADEGKLRQFRVLKARDLWKKMLTMLFETGHPWLTWKDPCNVRSPQDHVGVVHSSNLCTEITLNTSADETAVCNLGSVNLSRHIKGRSLDLELLKDTVTTAMRMLDNVVDVNFYPTVEARNSNMKHRPVGLGIMGFQDALYQLDIDFASDACVQFADRSMEAVSYYAILASSELAHERGTYASYRGSKWDRGILPLDTIDLLEKERGMKIPTDRSTTMDWTVVRETIKKYGMRNSNCMAIAPTATISNINGSVPSIEPIYKNLYVKANQFGDFVVINTFLVEDLKKRGLWNEGIMKKIKYLDGNISTIEEIPAEVRAKYKETFDIDPRWLILAAAHRGKWIDQSQSLNIFFSGSSGRELNDIYLFAWEQGIKTTYYLRSLAASQVEKSTVKTSEFGSTHKRESNKPSTTPTAPAPVTPSTPVAPAPVATAPAAANPFSFQAASTAPQTNNSGSSDAIVMVDGQPVKLCKINDPTCEACQ